MEENKSNIKKITVNRKARHDYEIVDRIEAGIVLLGSEVKSLRDSRVNISDAYAQINKGEVWIIGMHISAYKKATYNHIDTLRNRKLLFHKKEIKKLHRQITEKGITLVPLELYFKNNIVKVEIGIARGKRKYDKKAEIAQKDAKRDMEREEKKLKYKL